MATSKKIQILELLSEEQEALEKLDYDLIAKIITKKQHIISDLKLSIAEISSKDLISIRCAFDRSHGLLEAALQGYKSALEKIDDCRNAQMSLQVYSVSGDFVRSACRKITRKI